MLGSLSLQQLSYIVALDETRHFGLAAKKAGIAQPTLSMQIQKLEQNLGKQIFDRTKQPIVPTLVGERIIEKAREILRLSQDIYQTVHDDEKEISGNLNVGIIPTISPYLLPKILKPFVRKFPRVTLELHEWTTDQCIENLKKDRLDAAILATPLEDAQILEDPLYFEPFWIYHSSHHGMAAKKKVQPSDLTMIDPNDLWLLTDGHCFRSQVLEFCRFKKRSKATPTSNSQITFESGNLAVLKSLVDQYRGFTLLPELSIEYLVSNYDRKNLKPIVSPTPTREISLVTTRYFQKKRIVDALKAEIKSAVPAALLKKTATSEVVPI